MTDSMVPAGCRRLVASLLACAPLLVAGSAFAQVAPTMGFAPSVIGPGSASEMTITLDNPDPTGATDIRFTNVLPAGTTFVATSAARNGCRGSLDIAEGGDTLTYDGGRLASGGACTVSAYVTADTPGVYSNVTGEVTASSGNGGTAGADLTVDTDRTSFTKAFSPSTITPGDRSRLVYTLDASASTTAFGISNVDSLPSGLIAAAPPELSTDCTAIISPIQAGDTRIEFSGGILSAGASCTIALDVTAGGAGLYDSASEPLNSTGGQGGIAAARLTVQANPIDLVKRFEPAPAIPGETVTLTYRLRNNTRDRAATDVAFTDDLDAALWGLAATGLPVSDVCGAGSTLSGPSLLTLSGASLAPGAQCEFTVAVQIPAGASTGRYPSVSSDLTGELNGAPFSGPGSSAPIFLEASPLLEKTYEDPVIGSGDNQRVTYTLTNTSVAVSLNSFSFRDDIEGAFDPASTLLPASGFCNGSGSTVILSSTTAPSIRASNLSLAPGVSCEFEVTHLTKPTVPSLTLGTEPYNATGSIDGATVTARVEANDFRTVSAPALSLDVPEAVAFPDEEASLRLEISNDRRGAVDADLSRAYENLAVSVNLEAALTGLSATGLPLADVCGAGSMIDGGGLVSLSGGVLQPGETCAVTIPLQVPANAPPGPVTIESGDLLATTENTATSQTGASATLNIANLSLEADFGFEPYGPGEVATATYTVTNNSRTHAATDIRFRQILDERVTGLETIGLPGADVCGAGSAISGTGTLQLTGGSLPPTGSCVFEVQFQLPADSAGGGETKPGVDVATFTGDYNLLIDRILVTYDGSIIGPTRVGSILRLQAEGQERDLTPANLVEPNPDNDPISTEDEMAAGDVNGDGIPDALQSTVASFISPITGRPVSLEVSGDCTAIDRFEIVTAESLGGVEADWRYPEGLASFELPCDSATVTLYFPGAEMPRGVAARKFGPRPPDYEAPGDWYAMPGVTIDEEAGTISLTLVDGQLGDATGVDGVIVDPIGLASPFPPLPEEPPDDDNGPEEGPVDDGPQAIAIPTLGVGLLALLAAAFLVMGLIVLRRVGRG